MKTEKKTCEKDLDIGNCNDWRLKFTEHTRTYTADYNLIEMTENLLVKKIEIFEIDGNIEIQKLIDDIEIESSENSITWEIITWYV